MIFDYILGTIGVICFFIVVVIPWLVGIGDILDKIKTKEWRYK